MTPVMTRFLEAAADALPGGAATVLRADRGEASSTRPRPTARSTRLCDPMYARALRALIRDTLSPDVVHAGVKYNVIPGDAVDRGRLPDPARHDGGGRCRAEVERRIGADVLPACRSSGWRGASRSSRRPRARCGTPSSRRCAITTPRAIPLPVMAPFATDAKATAMVGTPTYGFSPLRLEPDERFLERFHGVDERISLDALRFGLPVLYDVVRRFCG